ncbi:MAG: DoxX family protein [Chloroflexi bacterium]|nr:DoxX family protein [Chloroflexota bacterium]
MDFSDVGLWIIQGLLGLAMVAAGVMKVTTTRESLMTRMAWVAWVPKWAPVAIVGTEFAGGSGLILPWAGGIVPERTEVAGACLAILMLGAVRVHADLKGGIPAGVMDLRGIIVAVGRAI